MPISDIPSAAIQHSTYHCCAAIYDDPKDILVSLVIKQHQWFVRVAQW
jgi:hypothetical protein